MLTYREFSDYYYKYGKCINDINKRSKELNNAQLHSRYEAYIRSFHKKENRLKRYQENCTKKELKIDSRWEAIKKLVYSRDHSTCQFYSKLSYEDKKIVDKQLFSDVKVLDICHIFPRSISKEAKYDIDNVVLMMRFFHSRIDQHKHPITGKPINNEEIEDIWRFIVNGDVRFSILKNRYGSYK